MTRKVAWYESVLIERFTPLTFGVVTLATIFILKTNVAAQFDTGAWKSSDLYSAVFGWVSIQTGFVFGIYGFVASKTDGFIKQVSEDLSFRRFVGYIKRANIAGFILTFLTLPMIITSPELKSANTREFSIAILWFSSFVWTFCAFLRVAFIFGRIVAVPDRPKQIPG